MVKIRLSNLAQKLVQIVLIQRIPVQIVLIQNLPPKPHQTVLFQPLFGDFFGFTLFSIARRLDFDCILRYR